MAPSGAGISASSASVECISARGLAVGRKKAGSNFGTEQPDFDQRATHISRSNSVLGRRTPMEGKQPRAPSGDTPPNKQAKREGRFVSGHDRRGEHKPSQAGHILHGAGQPVMTPCPPTSISIRAVTASRWSDKAVSAGGRSCMGSQSVIRSVEFV